MFKPEELPAGVSGIDAPGADRYARNVAFKHELNARWRAQLVHRAALERYYVVDRGGVRINKAATLALYRGSDAWTNIARGDKGIASWSKALCVRDPPRVRDLRCARLRQPQRALDHPSRACIAAPMRFPFLSSRNREIAGGAALLLRHFQQHAWPRVDRDFYDTDLRLCKAVGELTGSPSAPMPMYAVGMALFAHTDTAEGPLFQPWRAPYNNAATTPVAGPARMRTGNNLLVKSSLSTNVLQIRKKFPI